MDNGSPLYAEMMLLYTFLFSYCSSKTNWYRTTINVFLFLFFFSLVFSPTLWFGRPVDARDRCPWPPIGRRRPLTPLSRAPWTPYVRAWVRSAFGGACARVCCGREAFCARAFARSPGARRRRRRRALPVQWTLCTGPTVTPAHAAHHFRIDFILLLFTNSQHQQPPRSSTSQNATIWLSFLLPQNGILAQHLLLLLLLLHVW